MSDNVRHPSHYESGKYECIKVMEECFGVQAVKDFCLLCAFKYLYRCDHKHGDPHEDVDKARQYLEFWLKLDGTPNEEAGKHCMCDDNDGPCGDCEYFGEDVNGKGSHCARCRHYHTKDEWYDYPCWAKPSEDYDGDLYTLNADGTSITVKRTPNGISSGLRFKAQHIKAKTDPAFFHAAAQMIMDMCNEMNTVPVDESTDEATEVTDR